MTERINEISIQCEHLKYIVNAGLKLNIIQSKLNILAFSSFHKTIVLLFIKKKFQYFAGLFLFFVFLVLES